MKLIPLPSQTNSRTIKAVITYKDLTAAGTTQTLNLFPDPTGQPVQTLMPVGTAVVLTSVRLRTPFAGPSLATMTVDVGDLASASRYIAAANTDLFNVPTFPNTKDNVLSVAAFEYPSSVFIANQSVLTAKFTSTGANLNACTAGRVEIVFELFEFFRFDDPQEPLTVG